jgi:hypothetical protein
MIDLTLRDLQASVQDRSAFQSLADYFVLAEAFLKFIERSQPTRIISPTHRNYLFFQYGPDFAYRVTRPLNSDLFIESAQVFQVETARFMSLLDDLRLHQDSIIGVEPLSKVPPFATINKVVYTVQQVIGSIGDSFDNPNQSRKRVGQLFENLVQLLIREVGVDCEPRTVKIPIPGYAGSFMSYELDLVFSRNRAIVTAETTHIHLREVIGSVKTTSKDRIDKIFLDKYLLTKLLGRNVPVVAIFLHDVQRAVRGQSIFGINSTFKSNHFLGYSVALNPLDGVYYVDPRPEMMINERLRQQISDFQTFLVRDLWRLSSV